MSTERSEYRRLLADLYLDAVELVRSVASKPGATVADVVRALKIAPLVAFDVEIGEEPTSPGRPSPLRATTDLTRSEAKP